MSKYSLHNIAYNKIFIVRRPMTKPRCDEREKALFF